MDPENKNETGEVEVDPWAAAFAALEQKDTPDSEGSAAAGDSDDAEHDAATGDDLQGSQGAEQGDSSANEVPDGNGDAQAAGGSGDSLGADGGEAGNAGSDDQGISDGDSIDIEAYESAIKQEVDQKVIKDVAAAYIKQGVRNTNGQLGATVNDPDICKRDKDGVPRFYNPETGREFTGENPRRQAQEWCDDYNKELADQFNKTCAEYASQLMESRQREIDMVRFEPTYDKLDPIRRQMLDDLLEDYEITDKSGSVIGYSCDLNKALAAVDRQIASIQRYGKEQGANASAGQAGSQGDPVPSGTGPALDIKSAAHSAEEQKEINSIADGLLAIENKKLADLQAKSK